MLRKSPSSSLIYFGEQRSGRLDPQMGHLTCFIGGLYVLSSLSGSSSSSNLSAKHEMEIAQGVGKTCHESYVRTGRRNTSSSSSPLHHPHCCLLSLATGLGPEAFHFERSEVEAKSLRDNEKYFILRPETIETWFYLWRSTNDQIYRDWAWDMLVVRVHWSLVVAAASVALLEFGKVLSGGWRLFGNQRCVRRSSRSRRCSTEFLHRRNSEIPSFDFLGQFLCFFGYLCF